QRRQRGRRGSGRSVARHSGDRGRGGSGALGRQPVRLRMRTRSTGLAIALGILLASGALAAPAVPYHVPVVGVARDADDAVIPSGNLVVRIYPDSLGGSPVYNSGTEFNGEIVAGIFEVVAGRSSPLLLDPQASYFLEIDAAGVEVVGDAAGGRLRFRPGGGDHGTTQLETRIDALETAMGLPAPQPIASANAIVARGAASA